MTYEEAKQIRKTIEEKIKTYLKTNTNKKDVCRETRNIIKKHIPNCSFSLESCFVMLATSMCSQLSLKNRINHELIKQNQLKELTNDYEK